MKPISPIPRQINVAGRQINASDGQNNAGGGQINASGWASEQCREASEQRRAFGQSWRQNNAGTFGRQNNVAIFVAIFLGLRTMPKAKNPKKASEQ